MPAEGWAEERDRKSAAKSKKQARGRRANGGVVDGYQLTFLDWLQVQALTRCVVKQGGAVRVGLTRDGGALALGIYVDQDYGTEYVRPTEDLGEALSDIAQAWLKDGAASFSEALDAVADDVRAFTAPKQEPPQKRT